MTTIKKPIKWLDDPIEPVEYWNGCRDYCKRITI